MEGVTRKIGKTKVYTKVVIKGEYRNGNFNNNNALQCIFPLSLW